MVIMHVTLIIFFVTAYLVKSLSPPINSTSSLNSSFYPTATREHGNLNTIPLPFFLLSPHKNSLSSKPCTLLFLILLAGDIHLNPRPSTPFTICTLNIRSLLNPIHYTAIHEIALNQGIHLFALTETWISPSSTFAQLSDATPPGYTLISTPRPTPPSTPLNKIVGGGTAFLFHNSSTLLSSSSNTYKSFEMSSITLKTLKSKLTVFNIYRNHYIPSNRSTTSATISTRTIPFSDFINDFNSFISLAASTPHHFLITGDFNIHIDDPSDPNTKQFLLCLDNANLTQHVSFATHCHNHTLDLVITTNDSLIAPKISTSPVSPSDHFPLFTSISLSPLPPPPLVNLPYRSIKSINIKKFTRDIISSQLITNPPFNISDLIDSYNLTLSTLLNKHAPIRTKLSRPKPPNPWFTSTLRKLKTGCRHLEKIWNNSHSHTDLRLLRSATNHYHKAIIKAKRLYNSSLLTFNTNNPKTLWKTINKLLHRTSDHPLPASIPQKSLPQTFAAYFSDKIKNLHTLIAPSPTTASPHFPPPSPPPDLSIFQPATINEISTLLANCPDSSSELDPIPTTLLKQCKHALLPTITNIINLSLSTGIFPDQFKSSVVHPKLKKNNLDKDNLSNYRPISNLSFISKLTERLVKNRITHHLSINNLLNPHQSAYTKFHSTETTLLELHDHLIKAMSQQQVTGVCLLDLSAAFDTIDHTILLQRLSSWFGIKATSLQWIKSYLSSRYFSVTLNGIKSSPFQLLHGVPQGSVLGPLLFILYTTPLSSIISRTSVNHKLYADDTQLFISFSANNFTHNIKLLQDTISDISSWMSTNFLSLNPSKTEFMLIGLPIQLAKITNPSLCVSQNVTLKPVSSARNLGFILDSNLSLSDHISSVSKNCFIHIRDLRRIRKTLTHSSALTIATSLIHSKLDYCNSLYLNTSHQNINRLQLIQNAAARAVTRTPRFHHISPILKSLHWLKIPQRIEFKILSLTYKLLQNNKPTLLRQLLTIQTGRTTRSSTAVSLQRPTNPSRLKISDRSFHYSAPVLWNNLPQHLRAYSPQYTAQPSYHPLLLSQSQFLRQLKTHLFLQSYPP